MGSIVGFEMSETQMQPGNFRDTGRFLQRYFAKIKILEFSSEDGFDTIVWNFWLHPSLQNVFMNSIVRFEMNGTHYFELQIDFYNNI